MHSCNVMITIVNVHWKFTTNFLYISAVSKGDSIYTSLHSFGFLPALFNIIIIRHVSVTIMYFEGEFLSICIQITHLSMKDATKENKLTGIPNQNMCFIQCYFFDQR